MEYIVKCPYCEHNYVVNIKKGSKNFQCPNCGGQNGPDDAVQTLASLPKEEQKKYKRVYVEETQQESIDTIKKFNLSGYPLDRDSESDSEAGVIIGVIALLLAMLISFGYILIQGFVK